MTDKDIKKALECCANDYCHTSECPVFNGTTNEDCRNELIKYTLDLINRLQERKEYYKNNRNEYQDKVMFISKQCDELQEEESRLKAEIERLQELVDDMGDYFPACINCEGKTEIGERIDKCVYLIDNTNYCTKRGIANIAAIRNENLSLKEQLQTARAEAITEFKKLTYEACAKYGQKDKFNKAVFLNIIDRIAKEVKGEQI